MAQISPAQKNRLLQEALVEETKGCLHNFFKLSHKGQYLLNEEHFRCSQEDWNDHYLKGIEVHSNQKAKPTLSILIDDGDQIAVPLVEWSNLDDLVTLLDEFEQKKYSPL